jgi:uncharacterized membrane protein
MTVSAEAVLAGLSLLGAGLLAGEELVIRYGVRGPLARLDDEAHIRLRQALIIRLRVLVPAIYLPTAATAVALLGWVAVTLGGTVPINAAALAWAPAAPPPDWRARVDRWERLNTVRAWLALAAFVLLLAAVLAAGPGS